MNTENRLKKLLSIIFDHEDKEVRYKYFLRISNDRQIVSQYNKKQISKRECERRLIQCLALSLELPKEKVIEFLEEPCYSNEPNRRSALALIRSDHYDE